MKSEAKTPEEYANSLPEDRRRAINRLRNVINKNLPEGFAEVMSYGIRAPDARRCGTLDQ